MMTFDRPLLFCLTSTRNYAWCTRAFLEANSAWADYIIIVDQMSTDGTREMIAKYKKAIILDNEDLNYSETKRCEMALNYARSIPGDKILVYLAIDEVLPANIKKTEAWNRVLSSKPGDVFHVRWANIMPDGLTYKRSEEDMFRIFHDDGLTPFDNQGKDMHTHCLPYPNNGTDCCISDFPILHFGHFYPEWDYYKRILYRLLVFKKGISTSTIKLCRIDALYKDNTYSVPSENIKTEWLYKDFSLCDLVVRDSKPCLLKNIKEIFAEDGIAKYKTLNIWYGPILQDLNISDPRPFWVKLLHRYCVMTNRYANSFMIRGVDKLLSFFLI